MKFFVHIRDRLYWLKSQCKHTCYSAAVAAIAIDFRSVFGDSEQRAACSELRISASFVKNAQNCILVLWAGGWASGRGIDTSIYRQKFAKKGNFRNIQLQIQQLQFYLDTFVRFWRARVCMFVHAKLLNDCIQMS